MIVEWYFGFYEPCLKSPTMWFGHCEAWGYTEQDNWIFIDPQAKGTRVVLENRHDEVLDHLAARWELCQSILRLSDRRDFRLPPVSILTCAAICGTLVGVRALSPWGLRRKLLAKGATEIHDAKGRSRRQSSAPA